MARRHDRSGKYQEPLTIQRVLHSARTIAVVGLSNNPLRAGYFVGYYVGGMVPRDPGEPGRRRSSAERYASLRDVPEHVDIVNVFRAPDALPEIARQAVQIGAKAVWPSSASSTRRARTSPRPVG